MTPIDDDGPSDEEKASVTSNSFIDNPEKKYLDPRKRKPSTTKGHEGKIIEVSTARATHYESFPVHHRSHSSFSQDRESSRYNPSRREVGKAHDDSTNRERSFAATTTTTTTRTRRGGGIHARMIDEVRDFDTDVDETAAARLLRRRMYRLTLERNVSMEEKRRKMMPVGDDTGSTTIRSIEGRAKMHSLAKVTATSRGVALSPSEHSRPPPPPPSTVPSYRAIVTNLISNNEPEKIPEIDRVMQKYMGREEELIGKLDLRYKRKRSKRGGQTNVRSSGKSVGNGRYKDVSVQEGTKKERSAIQMMQSWDRKHTDESEEGNDDKDVVKATHLEETASANLGISRRTSSTKTEIHSNLREEKDDDERPLSKVLEKESLNETPTRASERVRNSPAFNDDISLITMETRGTMYRNRPTDGGEVTYSFAEMTRRPPASITVEPQCDVISPTSVDNEKYSEVGPPKIQRLLPEYEKTSSLDKAKAVEMSSEACAKLDSVEARILARRKLREEAVLNPTDTKILETTEEKVEENSAACEEEETFVGKSKDANLASSEIENSFSLIDNETNQVKISEEKVDDNKKSAEEHISKTDTNDKSAVFKTEEDVPVDEHKDRLQVNVSGDVSLTKEGATEIKDTQLVETIDAAETEVMPKTENIIVEKQDHNEGDASSGSKNEVEVAVPSHDPEAKLKEMEDEIARLLLEKESRFAAEKAMALKEAEQALEEERKARLEAEEARLRAEKELERLKGEADVRLESTQELSVQEESSDRAADESNVKTDDEEKTSSVISESDDVLHIVAPAEEETSQRDEEPASTAAEAIVLTKSMDNETKQELLSMIAEMEEKMVPVSEGQKSNVVSNRETPDITKNDNDSVDIVEKMRSKWASNDGEEESQDEKHASPSENGAEIVQPSAVEVNDDENDSDHSDEQSYLPGVLQFSPERNVPISMPLQDDIPSMDNTQLSPAGIPMLSSNDHDIPSMYMPHRQTSASQILDTTESDSAQKENVTEVNEELLKKPSVFVDEEGEANIHHIAKVTFDGNPAKGQLSFTSGSEVLAHSNQRGEWWLGRCGGRTGWFPASAVVLSSEFLRNQGPSLGAYQSEEEPIDDMDFKTPQLSQEELHEVYDLIRSPSGEDESPKRDPSEDEDHNEPSVNDQIDVKSAFDSMLDEYDSMLSPASTFEDTNVQGDNTLNTSAQTKQSDLNNTTSSGNKKPKRLWKSAVDPKSGLTYYYNAKTRETTWEKPADFVERRSPAKVKSPIMGETVEKDSAKSGNKKFLGLFSKPKKSTDKTLSDVSAQTNHATQAATPTSNEKAEAEIRATNELVESINNTWEVNDLSSVSSEGTSNSIFSAKKMKEVLGKVGSKLAGKMASSPVNAQYNHLEDSFSPQNNDDTKAVVDEANASGEEQKNNDDAGMTAPRSKSTTEIASNATNNEVKPSSDKKKDMRWRSAIDPMTGRTYYFHKDTKETVWEKPSTL